MIIIEYISDSVNRGSTPFPPAKNIKALERHLSEAFLFVGNFVT